MDSVVVNYTSRALIKVVTDIEQKLCSREPSSIFLNLDLSGPFFLLERFPHLGVYFIKLRECALKLQVCIWGEILTLNFHINLEIFVIYSILGINYSQRSFAE